MADPCCDAEEQSPFMWSAIVLREHVRELATRAGWRLGEMVVSSKMDEVGFTIFPSAGIDGGLTARISTREVQEIGRSCSTVEECGEAVHALSRRKLMELIDLMPETESGV